MEILANHLLAAGTVFLACMHILGILSAIDALYWVRTSQGAIAWGVSLVTFPYAALPLYWIFGRRHFMGYRELMERYTGANRCALEALKRRYDAYSAPTVPIDSESERAFENIAESEFTFGNRVELLVNGRATFDAIFAAIENAKSYIYVQFFILRDDDLGFELQRRLIERAKAGVVVRVLYDEIGSPKLGHRFVSELRSVGAVIEPFATRQGWHNFFQLNFRNHRKIVVIDGQTAFVGGHNVGNEYLGDFKAMPRHKRFSSWRDTHVMITGPAVISIEGTFLADWFWATQQQPSFEWQPPSQPGDQRVLTIASGPTDERERCTLMFLEAIHSARRRVWIASPYFVPDDSIVSALQLAALRGVDVRILLPDRPDHILVWLASFSYVPEVRRYGVRVLRYGAGFLHQKVLVVDDALAAIGTANLDNRSFRLNFEVTVMVADHEFNNQVAQMLEDDFAKSEEVNSDSFDKLSLPLRLAAKFARLFAPIL